MGSKLRLAGGYGAVMRAWLAVWVPKQALLVRCGSTGRGHTTSL
jgi:hypothetical protein